MAARAFQVRASVNKWLEAAITLASGLDPADRLAFQGIEGQQGNEWHVSWDGERPSAMDQASTRLVQITRTRNDGAENDLEIELSALLDSLGLAIPARGASVTVYNWPSAGTTVLGYATVRRLGGDGWKLLPDPEQRPETLRAVLTLQVDYQPA